MGNPPYNAVQVSFNDANPADKYPDLDKKIEETYVKNSTVGNKDKQYDMYKRFLKWASERIKNNGMVIFVSNNSFLDAKSDDGFRRSVFEEFDYIYTVNLKGNARTSGEERRKQKGNVFRDTIKVGVTISFFIKTGEEKSEIRYTEIADYMKSEAKLKWLADNSLSTLQLREIVPDEDAVWLNQTDNDFKKLVPIVSDKENSIFGVLSMGLASNRNEWVYDFDQTSLENKIKYFVDFYSKTLSKYDEENLAVSLKDWADKKIKWTEDFFKHIKRGNKIAYSKSNIKDVMYRPFVLKKNYFDKIITHRQRKFPNIFKNSRSNRLIGFANPKTNVLFQTLATDKIMDLDCVVGTQCIPLYTYDDEGKRHSNITDFGLELFQKHYGSKTITDEDVFYYTYAIFNDPKYQEKYKFNLQRKFPRIPLAENFSKWVRLGKKLYDLHVHFEEAEPFPLKRTDRKTNKNSTKLSLKKSESESLKIVIDEQTILEDVPDQALEYKFSSKCALEWILEFYKESKNVISDKSCDDPKIREKFNTYRFADYKEHVIGLLQKVTSISVETMNLRRDLENMPWGKQPELHLKKSDAGNDKTMRKLQTKKTRQQPKKPKKSKKSKLQDTLDGTGQKRLF